MLPYYAERFPTVEINYTFYRAPNEKILDGWNKATPERFKLTLKAPKRITHDARLRDCARSRAAVPRDGVHARSEAGRAAVSAAAEPEEGPGAVRRVSRRVSAAGLRRLRVPARLVARRGDLFDGFARAISRSASPTARSSRRQLRSRPITDTSGCATKDTRPTTSVDGPTRSGSGRPRASDVFVYFKHEESGKGPEFAPDV